MLPGIADKINKSYHSTIDDIPFRIYRNKEASSLEYVFVPDDVSFTTCSNEVQVDEESEDDDDYEEEYEDDDDESEIGTDNSPMTEQELMQSCLGSCLNKSLFSREENEIEPSNMVDDESVACSPENEFEAVNFSSALFRLSSSSQCSQLNALESTEYTIHRKHRKRSKKVQGWKI